MRSTNPVSVVILAAGNSSRMNYPKLFLPFDDGRNFLEKILEDYIDTGINQIILVISSIIEQSTRSILLAENLGNNIELVVNRFPEKGRFYSIQQGLKKVNSPLCFIQNIDNPFISSSLLREMIRASRAAGFVVPVCLNKDGHPVLLSYDIVGHLLSLNGHDHHLRNELNSFTKIQLAWPDENILANINTREAYRDYFVSYETLV